ncbi:hypothetical protein E4U55_001781, partial [Claviceps digitariae]
MAGSQQYKDVEILYILKAILRGLSFRWIITMFEIRFGRRLTENQVRYIKNKYGRDPRFGTPIANTHNFGINNNSSEWPESDEVLDIDFGQFERQDARVLVPNLRVSSFPRTAPPTPRSSLSSSPSVGAAGAGAGATDEDADADADSASSPTPRPPTKCPGPYRTNGDDTKPVVVAGQKRAHGGEDRDVDEVAGSLDLNIDQSHHVLAYGSTATPEEELTTTAVQANGGEGLPLWDERANAEPYFLAGRNGGERGGEGGMDSRGGMETSVQRQQQDDHHDGFLLEDRQMLWMGQHNPPLGSQIPRWNDVLPESDILIDGYEQHATHTDRQHALNADSSNFADTSVAVINAAGINTADVIYQRQLATTAHTINPQALLQFTAQDNIFQLPGPPRRENCTYHQVIQTSDNSI